MGKDGWEEPLREKVNDLYEKKQKSKKGEKQVVHVKALGYFLNNSEVKSAHAEVAGKDKPLWSTWQRRCCGEQGEKVGTKKGELQPKAIDHSFYSDHFTPLATMALKNPKEIYDRFNLGGLPAAGNSSDHLYLCVEYKLNKKKSALTLEESEKERESLAKQVKRLNAEAAANATSGTTAGTSKPKTVTEEKKDEGMLSKVKNFFYTSGKDKKLDWKKVVPTVGLGLGAVAAVAGAGVSMGVLGPEEKNMSGIAKAGIAAATLAGVGAAGYYGYKNYKAGKDDSEVDDADREVSLGGSGKSKKRHKSKDKKTEKGSNTMLLIFGGLAVLAVLAFLFLGKTEEKSASPLEGDELV